jgi:hypothetical protein
LVDQGDELLGGFSWSEGFANAPADDQDVAHDGVVADHAEDC